MKINEEAEISEAWRKESVRIHSSAKLGWTGMVLEYHLAHPGEKPLTSTHHHIVELAAGQEPSYGERPNRRGAFLPYSKHPGGINIYAEGVFPLLSLGTAKEARAPSAPLRRPRLKRVLDRMQADLSTDLDLHSLAKETGYSKSHFLRMFRRQPESLHINICCALDCSRRNG